MHEQNSFTTEERDAGTSVQGSVQSGREEGGAVGEGGGRNERELAGVTRGRETGRECGGGGSRETSNQVLWNFPFVILVVSVSAPQRFRFTRLRLLLEYVLSSN